MNENNRQVGMDAGGDYVVIRELRLVINGHIVVALLSILKMCCIYINLRLVSIAEK